MWVERLRSGEATPEDWMALAYLGFLFGITVAVIAALTWHPIAGVLLAVIVTIITDACYFWLVLSPKILKDKEDEQQ